MILGLVAHLLYTSGSSHAAADNPRRKQNLTVLNPDKEECTYLDCFNQAMGAVQGKPYCSEHIQARLAELRIDATKMETRPIKSDLTQIVEMLHDEVKKLDGVGMISFSFSDTYITICVHNTKCDACRCDHIDYDKFTQYGVDQFHRMVIKLQKDLLSVSSQ